MEYSRRDSEIEGDMEALDIRYNEEHWYYWESCEQSFEEQYSVESEERRALLANYCSL